MLERLQKVFRNVFDDQQLVITPDTSAKDIKIWDSLTHIELITAVEKEFDIRFSLTEVMRFEKVEDMINAMNNKL